jgi:hypothetical protein
MILTVTSEELEQFRTILADYPDALSALDVIADCEGDLEDAAITLAIQAGQEPNTGDRWLDGFAKSWRHVLCRTDIKATLQSGLTPGVLLSLTEHTTLSLKLVTPVAIYVIKSGVQDFCYSFESKIQ